MTSLEAEDIKWQLKMWSKSSSAAIVAIDMNQKVFQISMTLAMFLDCWTDVAEALFALYASNPDDNVVKETISNFMVCS